MRSLRWSAIAAALALPLAGCAGLPDRPADVVDTEQVSAIERAARASGNQVIWLRYPTRPNTSLTQPAPSAPGK
jgi:hypothetical protein